MWGRESFPVVFEKRFQKVTLRDPAYLCGPNVSMLSPVMQKCLGHTMVMLSKGNHIEEPKCLYLFMFHVYKIINDSLIYWYILLYHSNTNQKSEYPFPPPLSQGPLPPHHSPSASSPPLFFLASCLFLPLSQEKLFLQINIPVL